LFGINTFNGLQTGFLGTTFSYLDKVYITSKDARQLNPDQPLPGFDYERCLVA